MSRAPRRIAVTMFVGIPSVRRGIKEAWAPALFADSGPATPSMIPVPNFSGYREHFFSTAYDAKDETRAPPPGRMPRKNPRKVPRTIGHLESFQSCLLGNKFVRVVFMISR